MRFFVQAILVAAMLGLCRADARAFLWWRDAVPDVWRDEPSKTLDSDTVWTSLEDFEGPGLEFRASNDGSDFCLRVTSNRRDGRAVLSGAFRQDVTFWFIGTDGKARMWGVRLPFRSLGRPSPELLRDPTRVDDEPDIPALPPVRIGADGSSSPIPPEWRYATGLSGKNPSFGFCVPIRSAQATQGRVTFDFSVAALDADTKHDLQPTRAEREARSRENEQETEESSRQTDRTVGGGAFSFPGRSEGAHIGRAHRTGSSSPQRWQPADAIELKLSAKLAPPPARPKTPPR